MSKMKNMRKGKLEKEILMYGGIALVVYFLYRWYKKKALFSNAAGPGIDKYEHDFGRTAAHPDHPTKPSVGGVIASQSELSRLISNAKSKGIQVPEQRLMETFNRYNVALRSGADIPPTTIGTPQGKWVIEIVYNPPGIRIKWVF
tara:strand:- start:3145 stop:3579 length:435 start_codon:yes stop_codon:yes gene_type:complete